MLSHGARVGFRLFLRSRLTGGQSPKSCSCIARERVKIKANARSENQGRVSPDFSRYYSSLNAYSRFRGFRSSSPLILRPSSDSLIFFLEYMEFHSADSPATNSVPYNTGQAGKLCSPNMLSFTHRGRKRGK
jgi:hypothetical protein